MRAGKVARGGIRWSDRKEDFRTEILGLMKAQTVKNAVIVPVGSKGGFVVKQPPESREKLGAEGVECYKTLVRGLLDLTDNIVSEGPGRHRVVPPPQVVLHGVHFEPARYHRQPRARPRDPAGERSAPRRRRSLPRGRGRQGHRDLFGHRQCDRDRAQILARRRVRVGRIRGLRPQGHGHHCARLMGVGQAPLLRAGPRHPERGLHRRRSRRHVGRRVRERHADVATLEAARRLRSPACLCRPRPRCRA